MDRRDGCLWGWFAPPVGALLIALVPGCAVDRGGLAGPADLRADGGLCASAPEVCDDLDNDCDGEVDEDFDLDADPEHCGQCNRACPAAEPSRRPTCEAGECSSACVEGFADCDGDADNGCELDVRSDVNHCGACDAACSLPSAAARCQDGSCQVDACEAGKGDCDAMAQSGCEVDLLTDGRHCGMCGNACPAGQTCTNGTCGPTCPGGCQCTADCTTDACDCLEGCMCNFDCPGDCSGLECQGNCRVTASLNNDLALNCFGAAVCVVLGQRADDIFVRCEQDSLCDIDCRDTDSCFVDCENNAQCALDCARSGSCGFSRCDGFRVTCPNGKQWCNRDC